MLSELDNSNLSLYKKEVFIMDQMVLTVQQWLNATYGANSKFTNVLPNGVSEDGVTGTQVELALVTALQIELGISTPTGTFGPATTSAFTSMKIRSSSGNLTTPTNKEYILQGGFWCKGYNPGTWTGVFYTATQTAVEEFQADAGLSICDGVVTAMIMKALLNTDPFVLTSGGDSQIRLIQQRLNNKYNAYTGLMPTNGVYVAATNKALIYALQAEEGMSTSTANGNFGSGTTSNCPTLSAGDTRTNYVHILQYALYCNGCSCGDFDGVFGSSVTSAVKEFQLFMCLPVTGIANMPTIKATMTSCGDTNRSATACDCATILTTATASTLVSNGYKYVGRYLTGTVGNGINKALSIPEIQIILNAGLKLFPIYEDHGSSNSYFTYSQGAYDASVAISAAENLGIPIDAIIYFAVDYDAMDSQITSNVLPYFRAVKSYFDNYSSGKYRVGVYGARNTCSRVCNFGYAVSSFVGDMSTGYSGNLGFKMPTNWAFDQFTTVTIGSGNGQIQIDKDTYSGEYSGVDHINTNASTPTVINTATGQIAAATKSDPVDTGEGAHILKMTALKVKGALDLPFEISYDSSKLSLGTMGKGWHHNFEIRIAKVYDSLYVYWAPSEYAAFTKNSSGAYTCSVLGKQNDVLTVNTDGSYLLNSNNDMKYSFSSTGVLTNVQNRVGKNITLTKNASGNLVITEPISGQTLTVTYNTAGLIGKVTDQSGRSVAFNYDANACLTSITDANGKISTYTYDSNGCVLTGTDGDNVCCFTDTYDSSGRIVTQQDAISGNKLTYFSYDSTSVTGELIVTITDRNGNNSKNIFNSSTKQLISATDENGNTKSYAYDANGNIASETDELGNVASTTYDSRNHPLTQIDRVGAITTRTYDSNGNLLSVVNPDGGTVTFTYDTSNRVLTMTDTRNTVTTYTYDTNGLLTKKDVGSRKFVYAYKNGLLNTITDPKSGITTYLYDTVGRLVSSTDANGKATAYTFDANDNQLSQVDPLGNTTTFTYNSRGKVLTQTNANGKATIFQYNGNGKVILVTDPKSNTTTYSYDGEDRIIQIKDSKGNTTQTAYDPAGRVINKKDAQGNITAYTYDAAGNLLTTTKPNGGVSTATYYANGKAKTSTDAANNTNTYAYDSGWRLNKTTDALGKNTINVYNTSGELLSVTDQLGNKTAYTYDAYGNMLTKIDPNGNVSTYAYDANNNKISQTDALGNMTTYTYDVINRLTATTDANGHTSFIAYDASGRVISHTDALGNTSSITYDPNGNILTITDALNNVVSQTTYDATNLPTAIRDAIGNITTNTYDALGKLLKTIDPLNNKTTFGYDISGRLVLSTDALNGNSSVTYDADGNKTSVMNPLGGSINYSYDHSDRIISETTVSSGTISYGYNALNLISELTNARSQERNFVYDDAGRILSFTDSEGSTTYSYDANGNVLTITDPAGTITRQFDALNRVTKYTDVNANVIQYTYDNVGNLLSVIYPDGKTVSYTYNAANKMTTATDWANRVTKYNYDADGNLIKTERPDGSILNQVYDAASRLTSVIDKDVNNNVIISYNYTYDADGHIITESTSRGSVISSMVYDALNRLTGKLDKDINGNTLGSYSYVYDADGNITSGISSQQNASMTYDTKDRLNAYNGQNASFDLDGNMTSCLLGGAMVNLSFDSGNRLIQSGSTIYVYDAKDNRISSTISGNKTQYVFDIVASKLSQLLVRTDPAGNSMYFVYGLGLIGHQNANGYSSYHYDYRGSTVALTNALGAISDSYTYGAYGELLTHTGTSDTPFLYNGRDGVMTDSNGLYYARARYYAPELKRFINVDSKKGLINESKTLNVYAFVVGDPVMMIDPSGMSSEPGCNPFSKIYDYYEYLEGASEFNDYISSGVKIKQNGNILTIFGKNEALTGIDFNPYIRRIGFDNAATASGLGKLISVDTAVTDAFKATAKSKVALPLAAVGIGVQTYEDVQTVKSTQGKMAVGATDVIIGAGSTAAGIAIGAGASAATGALLGATIGSVVPGAGTVVGLAVGFGVGLLIDHFVREPAIDAIKKSFD